MYHRHILAGVFSGSANISCLIIFLLKIDQAFSILVFKGIFKNVQHLISVAHILSSCLNTVLKEIIYL